MDSSEEEQQQNFSQEFKLTKASKRTKNLPNVNRADLLLDKCLQIHDEVVNRQLEVVAEKIIQQINLDYTTQNQKSYEEEPSAGQKIMTSLQKIIMPICIRHSQEEYLEKFMKILQDSVKDLVQEEELQEEQKILHPEKFQVLRKFRKINFLEKQNTSYQDQFVSSISMYVSKKMKEIHTEEDITIYISKSVSNLSPENIYIFEKGLSEFNCCIICPTTHSFEETSYSKYSCLEIVPFKIFQHKQLFCDFMYKCICDPQIKAYLPKQSLKLINDFDDFPITYQQGCRRLIHCIHRLQMLKQKKNKEFKHIPIDEMFQVLEKTFKKVFKPFEGHNQHVLKKYIKCTLDDTEDFSLLDKYLNKLDYYKVEERQKKSQVQLVTSIREKLKYYIQKSNNIQQYSSYLTETQSVKSGKIKKDRELQRYRVDLKHCQGEKDLLQLQIKKIIASLTFEIKKQANLFKWEEYKFIDQIKPTLQYNIFKIVNEMSPTHSNLISFIYQKICVPLVRVIYKFCQQGQKEKGELMYYMKDLQLFGLIDISQSNLHPMVTPVFFEKSTYRTRKIG